MLTLLVGSVNATEFADMHKFAPLKDEQTDILVKYAEYKKLFKFRWTLYKNEGLVMFASYNKQVSQHILYLNTTNQSFRVYLKPKGLDYYGVPYFLVYFKEYDAKKKKARFEVFLSDKRNQIKLIYPKKK